MFTSPSGVGLFQSTKHKLNVEGDFFTSRKEAFPFPDKRKMSRAPNASSACFNFASVFKGWMLNSNQVWSRQSICLIERISPLVKVTAVPWEASEAHGVRLLVQLQVFVQKVCMKTQGEMSLHQQQTMEVYPLAKFARSEKSCWVENKSYHLFIGY